MNAEQLLQGIGAQSISADRDTIRNVFASVGLNDTVTVTASHLGDVYEVPVNNNVALCVSVELNDGTTRPFSLNNFMNPTQRVAKRCGVFANQIPAKPSEQAASLVGRTFKCIHKEPYTTTVGEVSMERTYYGWDEVKK